MRFEHTPRSTPKALFLSFSLRGPRVLLVLVYSTAVGLRLSRRWKVTAEDARYELKPWTLHTALHVPRHQSAPGPHLLVIDEKGKSIPPYPSLTSPVNTWSPK